MITPYAIGNQRLLNQSPTQQSESNQHQPSTSRNLPDVLSTKSSLTGAKQITPASASPITTTTRTIPKPQTNVQKLAQSFANNPNFHITRSPTSNRKIPQYTIPCKLAAASCSSKPDSTAILNSDSDSDRSNSHSDHSGGSDVTFKIDEIEYADA